MVAGETLPKPGHGPRHAGNHANGGKILEWARRNPKRAAIAGALAAVVGAGIAIPFALDGSAVATGQNLVLRGDPCDAIANVPIDGLKSDSCEANYSDVTLLSVDVTGMYGGRRTDFTIEVLDDNLAKAISPSVLFTSTSPLEYRHYGGFGKTAQNPYFNHIVEGSMLVNGQLLPTLYEDEPKEISVEPVPVDETQFMVKAGSDEVVLRVGPGIMDQSGYQQAAAAFIAAEFVEAGALSPAG